MAFEVVAMRSGARAIRDLDAGEIMHPGVGPVEEAEQLYVRQSRLRERLEAATPTLTLFDVGLGAASNAVAAWRVAQAGTASMARLAILSFERDLGALRLALTEAEAPHFSLTGEAAAAARALLERGRHETPRASWQLVLGDLPETLASANAKANVVFWDPYSPRANPALWTVAAFATLRAHCADDCTLFTYSASTAVRTALLLAGWAVGVGAEVGAKTQTTAAALRVSDLTRPLDARWLERLARSSAPWPADAPSDAFDRVRGCNQFS